MKVVIWKTKTVKKSTLIEDARPTVGKINISENLKKCLLLGILR